MGFPEEDIDVVYIEGVVEGPDLEVMQGCHGFVVPSHWNEL